MRLSLSCAVLVLCSSTAFAQTNTVQPRYFSWNNLTVDAKANQAAAIKDPFEKFNRKIFSFNDVLDRHIAKPVATQYKEKIPEDARSSYRSFRKNLGEPWNAVNQLIQGKPVRALKTLGRFTINTLTSLGFADPASRIGLTTEEESLGTTLGYYGVNTGPYVMLPILGPSTLRDSVGLAVDSQAQAGKYLLKNHDVEDWSLTGLTAVDKRAGLLDVEQSLPEDRYAAIRDIYLQRTAFVIAEKKGEAVENAFVDDISDEVIDDTPSEESTPQQTAPTAETSEVPTSEEHDMK
ncbi:MAG: VacJ family lipoprotein [Acinetobacter sp.]|nr:VacJ family lipoprotein [Acinetobacter sp.]